MLFNDFGVGKNIFKKVAKIPPGELQSAPLVIKWRDETEYVGIRWLVVGAEGAARSTIRLHFVTARQERPSVQAPEKFQLPNSKAEGAAMRKMREDSTWSQLTDEQREILEGWLFEENLGYAKILARVQLEFGIEATITSLCRYYRRRAQERQARELVEAQLAADELNCMAVDANSLRTAAVKLVGKTALGLASQKPEEIDQLASLTELLLEAEQNDLRRERFNFAQRCFDYEATVESLKNMPRLRAYMEVVWDDTKLNHDEKIKKIQMLFNPVSAVNSGRVK